MPPFSCSQTAHTLDVLFRVKNAKRPEVRFESASDAACEVVFGNRDTVALAFEAGVAPVPNIRVSPQNCVLSFRKKEERLWSVLPGVSAGGVGKAVGGNKQARGPGAEVPPSTAAPPPCAPSAATPSGSARKKVVVIEEVSSDDEGPADGAPGTTPAPPGVGRETRHPHAP